VSREIAASVGQGSSGALDANPGQVRRQAVGLAERGNPCPRAK